MDRRERIGDFEEALRVAMESHQSRIWTALPAIVISYDAAKQTCAVQPAIKLYIAQQDGSYVLTSIPVLLDCPVQFPSGGGVTLTFPIVKDDEVLVVFASRCIDSWWKEGGLQSQAEVRMHDLSDGFVLPGIKSQKTKVFPANTSAARLTTNDGNAYIELNPTSHDVKVQTTGKSDIHSDGNSSVTTNGTLTGTAAGDVLVSSTDGKVSATSSTEIDLTAPLIKLNGAVLVSGNFGMTGGTGVTADLGDASMTTTGDITAGGKSLKTHQHPVVNVQPGTATINSGSPL